MFEIIIQKKFSLELPENFEIPFIDENPLFISDRIPVAHSLAMEVDKTSNNLLFFGFPNRVTNTKIATKYPAQIVHFGSVIMNGELNIISVNEKINLQFVNAVMPENAKKKMNQIDFGSYDYGNIDPTPETLQYNDPKYDNYKYFVVNSVFNPENFITAPIRLKGTTWEGHEGAFGLKNAVSMYQNYFNAFDQSFTMPTPLGTNIVIQSIFPVIPIPYLHWIITHFFGETIQSNPFYDDPNLRKLVIVNGTHINFNIDNFYKTNDSGKKLCVFPLVDDYTVVAGSIKNKGEFNSFMKNYPFNDFLKNILSLFGISMFLGEKITFEYNNDLLETDSVIDITPFIVETISVSFEEGKIYNLNYGQDKTQNINVETTADGPKTFMNAYLDILLSDQISKNYQIWGMPNAVYQLTKKAVGVPEQGQTQDMIVESEIKISALTTQSVDDSEMEVVNMQIDVKPLDVNIEHYWKQQINPVTEYIKKHHWVVPVLDAPDTTSAPNIMIDLGLKYFTLGENYRMLSNSGRDAYGLYSGVYLNLCITEDDPMSVFEQYHKKIKWWHKQQKTKITCQAILSPAQNNKISNKKKIHLMGKNFHILKREYTLSKNKFIRVTFDLIEAFSVLSDDE